MTGKYEEQIGGELITWVYEKLCNTHFNLSWDNAINYKIESALLYAAEAALQFAYVQERAKQAEEEIRAAMQKAMKDSGCTHVAGKEFSVTLAEKKPSARVTIRELVPPQYFKTPDPVFDRAFATAALRKGIKTPGVELDNGGPPVVRITPKKGT